VKAKDLAEENDAIARMQSERPTNAGTTNLGALLKAKLDTANSSSEQ
jgi:small subunit ribosomal protein S1